MRITEFTLANITSYKERTSFTLSPKLNIFIGPNGAGKTNAIQCLWLVLEKFFFRRYKIDESAPRERRVRIEDILGKSYDHYLEKNDANLPSRVEVTVVPDAADAENVRRLQASFTLINDEFNIIKYADINKIQQGHIQQFLDGLPTQFTVVDGSLEDPVAGTVEHSFLTYCRSLDLAARYSSLDPSFDLTTPIFFMQSIRQASAASSVNVGGWTSHAYFDARHSATSSAGGSLSNLAYHHFGRLKLKAIKASSALDGGPLETTIFDAEKEVVRLREYLSLLGYTWNLEARAPDSWDYLATFKKEGSQVRAEQFSSGEREIFNFLYGLVGTNVQNGLVIIDEPELHLHPKSQDIFLRIFLEVAADRNLQFVITTHSPSFVTHQTIDAVTGLPEGRF